MSARAAAIPASLLSLLLSLTIASSAQSRPQVVLNADDLGPRSIEQLTGTNLTRAYALAWSAMAEALEQNRPELLNDQFTGFAIDRLTKRITDQQRNGLHVHVVDNGHHVKAVFYSLDGDAMQLVDEAQIQWQVFDGSKLIYEDDGPRRYFVLMTPGADRWYIRYFEQAARDNHDR